MFPIWPTLAWGSSLQNPLARLLLTSTHSLPSLLQPFNPSPIITTKYTLSLRCFFVVLGDPWIHSCLLLEELRGISYRQACSLPHHNHPANPERKPVKLSSLVRARRLSSLPLTVRLSHNIRPQIFQDGRRNSSATPHL